MCAAQCLPTHRVRRVDQSSLNPTRNNSTTPPRPQIEDFPLGYPRFAALIGAHPSFHLCRRFSALRARLMLHKQDHLSALEQQLERIDREEPRVLFLGNYRRDGNAERKQVLEKIDEALAEYDTLVDRNRRALGQGAAKGRDIANLTHWVEATGCVARLETEYLAREGDLMAVGEYQVDGALDSLEGPVEDLMIWASEKLKRNLRLGVSRDPNIHIFSPNLVDCVGRSVLACLLVLLLFIPVVIVDVLHGLVPRLAVILMASALFIAVLSVLTKSRTGEVFVAGATYVTVLVVFIAGNGIGN